MGKVVTGSGFEDTVYQGRMCATGGMNEAISGECITVIPSLPINVLQKLLTDS